MADTSAEELRKQIAALRGELQKNDSELKTLKKQKVHKGKVRANLS